MSNINLNDINEITLDLSIHRIVNVHCVKNDTNTRKLYITLTNNGEQLKIDDSIKVRYKFKKPDGKYVYNDVDNIESDGKIYIDLTDQCVACSGIIHSALQLTKSSSTTEEGQVISSMPFNIIVKESEVSNETIESTDEFNALNNLIIDNDKIGKDLKELETTVKQNEAERQTAEEKREQLKDELTTLEEIFVSNESKRITQENERQTHTSTAISNAENATERANKAAENANAKANDLQEKLDSNHFVLSSQVGVSSGVAELDENGKVLASQLPSYVDDIVEGYITLQAHGGKFFEDKAQTIEIPSESGKIYVDIPTNTTWRWGNNGFVEISASLALGENSSTAYRGDRGKTAYDHSQTDHARVDATKTEASSKNGNIKINDAEVQVYKHPEGTNPHGTTKNDVGLENVPNVATNDQTPTYTEAESLAKLSSGEKLSVAFGKISKAITDLISHIGDTVKHITSTERTNWTSAYTHSTSAHAPSTAEKNIIVGIQKNGTDLTVNSSTRKVNITVPTSIATTSANGLMASSMVTKLNDIEDGANKTFISNSTAITTAGTHALDARENNSSITGTLAHNVEKSWKASQFIESFAPYDFASLYGSITDGKISLLINQTNASSSNASYPSLYNAKMQGTVTVSTNQYAENSFEIEMYMQSNPLPLHKTYYGFGYNTSNGALCRVRITSVNNTLIGILFSNAVPTETAIPASSTCTLTFIADIVYS